jgi:UDP-N-acetylglucosamine 1-carboxyvinyltransferase
MDKFVIQGGIPLRGEVAISGAKNSALPVLAACLLTKDEVRLSRIPAVRDIGTMEKLLSFIGAKVSVDGDRVTVQGGGLDTPEAPYELVKTMRASSLVLGPLVGRAGRARVSMPGGCAIGARPIDLHVSALEHLGATITQSHGYVEADAPQGLKGAPIHFDRITVTGTEDVLMAAVLAKGDTVITNAAREPEVQDLAAMLQKMGACIEGAGTSTIRVRGVTELHGCEHAIIADRIEAGTFMIASAMTGGDVVINGCEPVHVEALAEKMREAGATVEPVGAGRLRVTADKRLKAVDMQTEEYPGFATDLQAQFMAMMCIAEGTSVVTETIFENRYMHVQELARMGANIRLDGRKAMVAGVDRLMGAEVIASDLRASASLVLAGLVGRGQTILDRVYHIDRGYEKIEAKLVGLGARIERVSSK